MFLSFQATMLKKKKGNNPSVNPPSTSNHATSGKIRSIAMVPVTSDVDSGGYDDQQSNTGCSNKNHIYSTTV